MKSSLKQEIDDKKSQIHQFYTTKIQDINKIDDQTEKLIEQCEQLEVKRKELIEQIEDYSKLENHARHVNSNYHQVHHLNQFIDGIKQLIQLQHQIHGKQRSNLPSNIFSFLFHFEECRQLCKKGYLYEAKEASKSIDNLMNNEYLFPKTSDKFYQQHYPLYETFQRSVRQLRSDICQTHHILWNDGVERTTTNQIRLEFNQLEQLFKCIFDEDQGEKLLMEKNIQTFATYCLQEFIRVLIDKKMKLDVDVETTMVLIRMETDEDVERDHIEELNEALNYLKNLFEILNMYLLSRVMKIQTSKEK